MQSEEEKWRDLVGGFILTFGEIELFTYLVWSDYCHTTPPHRFGDRVKGLLAALRMDEAKNRKVIEALGEALRLADKRNTVAHNPTQVEIFEHSRTGQVFLARGIYSRRSSDYIDDIELAGLRESAEHIASRLYASIGALSNKNAVGERVYMDGVPDPK